MQTSGMMSFRPGRASIAHRLLHMIYSIMEPVLRCGRAQKFQHIIPASRSEPAGPPLGPERHWRRVPADRRRFQPLSTDSRAMKACRFRSRRNHLVGPCVRLAVAAVALGAVPGAARATDRGVNRVVNPGFESHADGRATGWSPLNKGYELVPEGRDGGWCVKCSSDTGDTTFGAGQTITFAEPVQHPLVFSAWSRTTGTEGYEYSVYLDVHYADGTAAWGRNAHFRRDSGEWNRVESVFAPEKPVARIGVFVSFQRIKGTAWFDDVSVSLAAHEIVDATVLGGFAGDGGIEARAAVRIPSAWTTEIIHQGRVVHARRDEGLSQRTSWDGRDAEGRTVPPGTCTVRFTATDLLRGETAVLTRDIDTRGTQPGRTYAIWSENSMTRVMPTDLPMQARPPGFPSRRPETNTRAARS